MNTQALSKNFTPAGYCNCRYSQDIKEGQEKELVLQCSMCQEKHYFGCEEFNNYEDEEEIDYIFQIRCDACNVKYLKNQNSSKF